MTALRFTRHAETRMRQRGLRDADIALVMEVASPAGPDAWLLTDADISEETARLRHRIQSIERLRGCKVVVAGDAVITAYRSNAKNQRRSLRGRDT